MKTKTKSKTKQGALSFCFVCLFFCLFSFGVLGIRYSIIYVLLSICYTSIIFDGMIYDVPVFRCIINSGAREKMHGVQCCIYTIDTTPIRQKTRIPNIKYQVSGSSDHHAPVYMLAS